MIKLEMKGEKTMLKYQLLGFVVVVILVLPLSGCGKSPSGKKTSDNSQKVQNADKVRQEVTAKTPQSNIAKPELPEPQQVYRNTKAFANLALMSGRTTGGRSVVIDIIPGDYNAIAIGHNFVFPEEDCTMSNDVPFVTVSFTRENGRSADSVSLTVKRDGKAIVERNLKAGESFSIELAMIKEQGDSIEWNVSRPNDEIQEKDGMALPIYGTKRGLVCCLLQGET